MEKPAIADPIIIPEIVISEHLERPSSASSKLWNSTSFTLPSQSRPEARSHHGIEFADSELPPPLPPRLKPLPQTEPRSAEAQLPPPIPSRSMLRTMCNGPLHEAERIGALSVPTPASGLHKIGPAAIVATEAFGGRNDDALTVNKIRSHLPHSFYAPPPSAREIEMRKVPTSYYAPIAEVVCGREDVLGTENTAQEHMIDVRSNRRRQAVRTERARRCCACRWTRTRVLVGLRVINCTFAAVIVGSGLFVSIDMKLGQAGLITVCTASIHQPLIPPSLHPAISRIIAHTPTNHLRLSSNLSSTPSSSSHAAGIASRLPTTVLASTPASLPTLHSQLHSWCWAW